MDRRTFLLAAAAAMVGLEATWAEAPDLDAWLRAEVSAEPAPRRPERTGRLAARHHRALLGLFRHIGERWDMAAVSGVGEPQLSDLLRYKTERPPSYLTEYREAAAVLAEIAERTGSLGEAHDRLLLPLDVPGFPASRLGRAQRFVSAELIVWYVSQGGFRRFGYANYRGFVGGRFTAVPPPYRRA